MPLLAVVKIKAGPQFIGLNPHNCVDSRVKIIRLVKDIDTQRVSFEFVGTPGKRFGHQMRQEPFRACGVAELRAGQNAFELFSNHFRVDGCCDRR